MREHLPALQVVVPLARAPLIVLARRALRLARHDAVS